MARRRNPMPTHGALFITNPRRKNPMATRRRRRNTTYRRRRNRTVILRSNSSRYQMMARSGKLPKKYQGTLGARRLRALYSKKGKSAAQYKKDKAAFDKLYYKAGGEDARIAWRDGRGARVSAYKAGDFYKSRKKTTKKKTSSSSGGRKKFKKKDGSFGYMVGGKFASKAAYDAAGGGSTRKSRTKKGGSRKLTPAQLKAGFGGKSKMNPSRRRNSRRRRNPSRRRNGAFGAIALRTNQGMDTGIMPIDAAAGMVDKVPFVGPTIAPYVAPLAVGAASGALLVYAASLSEDYLPEWAARYTYPIAGVLGAVVTLLVPIGQTRTKRLVAAGMATVGAGIWAFEAVTGRRDERIAMTDTDIVAMAEGTDLAGLALLENRGYGMASHRGYGAYQFTGGTLNGYGDVHVYNDAAASDALASGADFDAAEGQALMRGPQSWWRHFGRPSRRMTSKRGTGGYSRHAGQRGHRWGWLIKLVGFEGARQIAGMSPKARLATINKLKSQARASLHVEVAKAQNNGHQAMLEQNIVPDQPPVYESSGPTGAHGYGGPGGYGALALQENPYGALVYSGGPL